MQTDHVLDIVVSRVGEVLNDAGKAVNGSRVLGVGVAFKPGVADLRQGREQAVLEHLAAKGAIVSYHDPFVPRCTIGEGQQPSLPLDAATVGAHDLVLILTPHPGLDVQALVSAARMVFDTRGVTQGIDSPNVIRL